MNSPEEYIQKTKSAVLKLFDGINSYNEVLCNAPTPIFNFSSSFSDEEAMAKARNQAYESWILENKDTISLSLKAQKEYFAESFASATLCGSLLQIAAMGIQLFSQNEEIAEDLPKILRSVIKSKSKLAKFCIGRRVRNVPIGLVIYAGRNQFNHIDEEKLNELNVTIFKLLASNWSDAAEEVNKDLAFDLEEKLLINFSSNITGLLGWKSYELYDSDMHSLLIEAESEISTGS
ncbi:hypothetical protein COO91_09814 (plasmid) [Nostoc flagelliforme CCNUN1]|uniref:Uncharacterized protein n=1 Tax=Nostoc flagelliforme CCNUN1 TaxID=2038116 RepID=A0A2K8T7R3_9NOSO|nr:hypothetical protein [Nostoc flagelliforme]AUB43633.1 hypothetical protein COO91_09814 [Nostoc flagelliforme CCNUN1]